MNTKRFIAMALSVIIACMVFTGIVAFRQDASLNTVEASETDHINSGSTWKYLDNGTDPGSSSDRTSWTAVDFDDSAWKSASGKFGAKAGELKALDDAGNYVPTVLLNHYQSNGDCVPTYFFRCEFELKTAPPADGLAILGTIRYDDAAIVYINGIRVAAFDEPEGGFESNLSYGGSGAYDPKTATFTADTALLQPGKNVVAVELHNQRADSSDVWFDMPSFAVQEYFIMNVGADESQRNFNWYYPSAEGSVQYALRNGNSFPSTYKTVNTTSTQYADTYIHKATITDLAPNSEYVYRIVNGDAVSKNFYFKTSKTDSFNFLYVGDPQIGASWGAKDDVSLWNTSLKTMEEMFPDTALLVSAGDQIEVCTYEKNYQGFMAPSYLSSLAVATSVGNHENDNYTGVSEYDASLYNKHYNLPNTSTNGTTYGVSKTGSDYWYTYNNTLFMHINANSNSIAEHKAFMQAAMNANPDVTWKIAVMHFSMFGAGSYYVADVISSRRELYAPLFEEMDVDVVLAGHEHIYARTHMVNNGFQPDTSNGVLSSVTNPVGVLYLTASSSSGTKYYDMMDDANTPHIAVKEQHVTTFTNVEIDGDSLKLTTYRVNDKSVLDTFEIIKDENAPTKENLALNKDYDVSITNIPVVDPEWEIDYSASLTDGNASLQFNYKDGSWFAFKDGHNSSSKKATLTIYLEDRCKIDEFKLNLANSVNGMSVYPPKNIDVYAYFDGEDYKKVGTMPIDTTEDKVYWSVLKLDEPVYGDTVKFEFTLSDGNGWAYVNEAMVMGEVDVYPNIALGEDYEISVTNDPVIDPDWNVDYSAKLTDGEAAEDYSFDGGKWFMFSRHWGNVNDRTGTIQIDFDKICEISMFKLHLINNPQADVFAPTSIKVFTSIDGKNYELAGSMPIDDASYTGYWSKLDTKTIKAGSVRFEFLLNGDYAALNEVEIRGIKTDEDYVPTTDGDQGGDQGGTTPDPEPVTTLSFALSDDERYYSVVGCDKNATTVEIPATFKGLPVNVIAEYAFDCCSNLTSVTIPESVTTIENCAFVMCTRLTSINLPAGVAYIHPNAYSLCNGIETITVAEGNNRYVSNGNCLIDKDAKTLVIGCKNSVIPTDGSVTKIGSCAFTSATGIKNIEIPNTITSIGDHAFEDCSSITKLVIPTSVTSIGKWAFSDCRGLTQIVIPASVKTIGEYAFTWSGLTDIYCEAESKPSGWADKFNYDCSATVHWNYTADVTPDFIRGDVNLNNKIDSRDYLLLKRAYFGTTTLNEIAKKAADVNKNDKIDSRDYMLLKRAYFGTYTIAQ